MCWRAKSSSTSMAMISGSGRSGRHVYVARRMHSGRLETARLLFMEVPGGSGAFYRGASEPAARRRARWTSRVSASAARHGSIVILGPPHSNG
jgi:hypothetical protein